MERAAISRAASSKNISQLCRTPAILQCQCYKEKCQHKRNANSHFRELQQIPTYPVILFLREADWLIVISIM